MGRIAQKTADCGCLVNFAAKYKGKEYHFCTVCGKMICNSHLWRWVDENNISITKNARPYCEICYSKKYTGDYLSRIKRNEEYPSYFKLLTVSYMLRSIMINEVTKFEAEFSDEYNGE